MRIQIIIDGQDYGDVVLGKEVEQTPRRLAHDAHKQADNSGMHRELSNLFAQAKVWIDSNVK